MELFLDFFLFFPQFLQIGEINRLPLSLKIFISVLINQAFFGSLLSTMVFALFGQCQTSFCAGKSLAMTLWLYHIQAVFPTTNFRWIPSARWIGQTGGSFTYRRLAAENPTCFRSSVWLCPVPSESFWWWRHPCSAFSQSPQRDTQWMFYPRCPAHGQGQQDEEKQLKESAWAEGNCSGVFIVRR